MTDYEYYKDKYNLQLDYFTRFPVWSLEQILRYMHLHYDTIQKLVNVKLLYKFNVGRLTFYTKYNKHFTNQSIIKSMLRIDAYFRVNYSDIPNFVIDTNLDNSSLSAKHVEQIGYVNDSYKPYYYNVYSIYPLAKAYKKIERLLIDLQNNSNGVYIIVNIFVYGDDKNGLEAFLEASSELVGYKLCKYITYQIINVDYPHFKILSNNL